MLNQDDSQQHLDGNARLQAVLNSAVDGIITISERGIIEDANPAAEKLFGYALAEIVGCNVKLLMPTPYREEHDGYLANYSRTGERKIIGIGREVEGQRKDGSTFPLYLAVSEVLLGDRKVFTGFVHDLTELRKAEARATQLGRILENSLNEIFVFDTETLQFLFVNRGAVENMGYSAGEVSTLTPFDIKPEMTVEQFHQLLTPLSTGKTSVVTFETVHQRKDGSRYDVSVRLQIETWEGRKAFVATILDITQLKSVQKELADLNAALEQRIEQRTIELQEAQSQLVRREKLATLGQLAGGVAHEIRNPLGVIKNSVYYLKMISNQLDDEGKACIEEIDREVMTANRIVSELLDFTRDPSTSVGTFSLNDVISCAVKAAAIPETVNLTIDEMGNELLRADQGQVERVLINLIHNACQAMSGKGTITISKSKTIDHITIHITDTGVGISPSDLNNVFEPLFTTKAKGIGLGLAVSRRYAQRNGGSLTVESQVGTGATFHFSIPYEKSFHARPTDVDR